VKLFTEVTDVSFKNLSNNEINYYLDNYNYSDKAGAYGIQEWIGMIGVERIEGDFYNVMGLPIVRLYEEIISL
jgi:septum formation protein